MTDAPTGRRSSRSTGLLEGLAEAHERGFVHRDIKPQNVMLGPHGRVKLLDFGLAKAVHGEAQPEATTMSAGDVAAADLTAPGMLAGTLTYMSPEQAAGQPVDARSDIFSLGTVLYEMAVGRNPFRGETPAETVVRILAADCDPPSSLRPDLSAELEAVISRCLERLPAGRFANAGELLADLQRRTSGNGAD